MRKVRFTFQGLALLAFMFALTSMTHAQATRTWVSGVGDDVNPCSRTAPCKTFAGAISKTAEGGEIDALDEGGFGTITITKAITLDGTHGSGFGSILNAGTNGVNVNVTGGTHVNDAVVILRSLSIQGVSQSPSVGAINGINYIRADRLYVQDCQIRNQGTAGINANMASSGALFVSDTVFSNVNVAIKATTTVGKVFVTADNINASGSNDGVQLLSNAVGVVRDSVFARNLGVNGALSAASGSFLTAIGNELNNNNIAINALAGSTVRADDNHIYDNSNGFAGSAASISSGSNNKLAGNTASITPTGPPILNQ